MKTSHLTSQQFHTQPKAILFDWDNTLINSWPMIHSILNQTLVHMGHQPWTLDEAKQKAHASARDSFPLVFGGQWQKAYSYFYECYARADISLLEKLPHADSLLKTCQQQNILMGIVSNKRGDNLRKEVDFFGWSTYFSVVLGSGDATNDKPHPAIVLKALETIKCTAAETWFVGDTPVDKRAALSAGCAFIGIEKGSEGDFFVETLQELAEILLAL